MPPFRALALLGAIAATPAAADQTYYAVFVGSQHIGSDDFNDVNPGLTFGKRFTRGNRGFEYHVEAGIFYNSYEEVSPIAVAGLSTRVAEVGIGELRLGTSLGLAYYGELSDRLVERDRFPDLGGILPVGAVTGTYRRENVEYRLSVLPYGDGDLKGVVNFSFAVGF